MTAGRAAFALLVLAALCATEFAQTPQDAAPTFTDDEIRKILQHSPLPPPPADETNGVADDANAARLGQRLFFDKRLSRNGEHSCATCHLPDKGFADAQPFAQGLEVSKRHAPTLWNSAYNRWYFWDGRADSLWAQAVQPIESPAELGGSRMQTARVIYGDPALRRAYESLFGPMPDVSDTSRFPPSAHPMSDAPADPRHRAWSGMSQADRDAVTRVLVNAAKTIAAYERQLVSRRAPFDVFVEGLRAGDADKRAALSPSAQRGLKLFVGSAGCRFCHNGPNFSDGEFHNIRVPPGPGGDGNDPGRYRGAQLVRADPFNAISPFTDAPNGSAADKIEFLAVTPENFGRFKTPSLRNVSITAPYMHQGQFATLRDVLEYYSTMETAMPPGHHETEVILQPLFLGERQIADLQAFLESLTDTAIDPSWTADPNAGHTPPKTAAETDKSRLESHLDRSGPQ